MNFVRFRRALLAATLLVVGIGTGQAQAEPTVTSWYGYGPWALSNGTYCRAIARIWVTTPGSTVNFSGRSECQASIYSHYVSVGYSINSGIKTSKSNMCNYATTCQGASFSTTRTTADRNYCTILLVTYNLDTSESSVKLCKVL